MLVSLLPHSARVHLQYSVGFVYYRLCDLKGYTKCKDSSKEHHYNYCEENKIPNLTLNKQIKSDQYITTGSQQASNENVLLLTRSKNGQM